MKSGRGLIVTALVALAISACAARGETYLESKRACDGSLGASAKRFEIVGWDGDSRSALGQQVYDFRVRCGGGERDLIDLFIAAERSDRYRRDGAFLQQLERTERRRVQVKEAGCKQVPRRLKEPPPDSEVREACRHQRMPMACEIDMMAQRRIVTRMVEECWRAVYETREVPVWTSFPEGHAPLPRWARIVQAGAPVVTGTVAPAAVAPTAAPSSSDGSPFGIFLLLALAGAGGFYWMHLKNLARLQEQVASARAQMGGGGADFGASFRAGGASSAGFRSASAGGDDRQAYEHQRASGQSEQGQSHREPPKEEPPERESDGVPRSVEEACALLNVTPETPAEEISRVYKSMALVWHVDKAKDEKDRQLREQKMRQLNAAKDLLMKRQSGV